MDLLPALENFVERWVLVVPSDRRAQFVGEARVLLDEAQADAERSRLTAPSEALLFDVRRVLSMAREGLWTSEEVLRTLDTLVDAKDTEEDKRIRLLRAGTQVSSAVTRGLP